MPQNGIVVTPPSVEFRSVKSGDVCSATVQVTNLNKSAPVSFRVRRPATEKFKLRATEQTQRIAPGLSARFEVVFDGTNAEPGSSREYDDCVKIVSEVGDVEVPLRANPPKPELQIQGELNFGMLATDSTATKRLQLVNKGPVAAEYNISWDKTLPVRIEPCSGVLSPHGSPGNSSSISVKLVPVEIAAIGGEVVIAVSGMKEPYRVALTATAVQQSCELINIDTQTTITELQFGSMFFGESAVRNVAIFNNGPAEVRFDLSYGSTADMAAIAAVDKPEGHDGGQHAAFLQMALVRAKAREQKDSMLKVTPISGVVAPYSKTQLQVVFKPLTTVTNKGFAAQPLTPQQQSQPCDCLLQISLGGGSRFLRLPIKGTGLAPSLKVRPQVLHFGVVPTYEWADQLLELVNSCTDLPMRVQVGRSGPYFAAEPSELHLPPGASTSVLVRYLPKALGRHQASLNIQAVSIKAPGKVLFETAVQVQGSSLTLGQKRPLPGGITATPDTITKPRAYVDESEAAVAELKRRKTFSRPQTWETPENAYSLDGIGPLDRFGLTKEVHIARAEHAAQYTTFIQARRKATTRKYLTQKEGDESDINLGMKPYRGLSLEMMQLPKQVDPLWTLRENSVAGTAVQKPPSAALLANVPTYKEWPDTPQERDDCQLELNTAQLSKIVVGPRQLDYGKVSPAFPSTQHFVVTNNLGTAIHVVLDLGSLEGLTCSGPVSQVIPAAATAKFPLVLQCHDVQILKEKIHYCINGCHMQSLEVLAEVVAVTLDLSCEELVFGFSLENWDNYVEQGLIMENPHNFPVDYEWALSSSVFSVYPAAGTMKPKSSHSVSVRWTPSAASVEAVAGSVSQSGKLTHSTAGSVGGNRKLQTTQSSKVAGSTTATPAPKASAVSSSGSASKTAITVELPPEIAAGAAAAAAAGCQHTDFMTLKLKGGADAAPKKVLLHGELPAGMLKFKDKEVNIGPVPIGCQQTAVVQMKNSGSGEVSYRVVSNALLAVTPDRGHVPAESAADLEVSFLPQQLGQFSAVLEVEVRGSRPLKLPIRAEGVAPCVHVAEPAISFSPTFCGASSQMPLTLVNTTPVPAMLLCDLTQQPEFELVVSREDWAGAGYAACPVQKIGANGEMIAVGSTRASRRMTSHGGARQSCMGECGFRFLIKLNPSSTLPLRLAYRPSKAQAVQFALPMVLHNGSTAIDLLASSSVPSKRPASSVAASALAVPGRAGSVKAAGSSEEVRSKTASTTGGSSKPGSRDSQRAVRPGGDSKPASAGSTRRATDASNQDTVKQLAVPVSAVGVTPKLILSQDTVAFGSKVVRTSTQPGKSPYSHDVYIRNNTDTVQQVAVGMPAWPNSQSACLGAYTLEGLESTDGFVSLGPEEGIGWTVRFTPADAKEYEAKIPIFINGDKSAAYMHLSLSGAGTLPKLTFDVTECLLPPVPLNVESRARFHIVNDGYDNLELSPERVRLPPDTTRLPLKLSFPEGNLIGLAKDRLPVDVTFCSARPISFTAIIDLLDESGRAFSVAVTGAADNCSLSIQPFLQLNADQLQLIENEEAGGVLCLEDSPSYQMPVDEAIGPMQLTPGICKYLTAMTSRNWSGAGSRINSANGASNSSNDGSAVSHACEDLRKALKASKGKQLQELVETLGGKTVSLKGAGHSKPSGNKTEAAQQVLAVYEAILSHIRAHGGLVNAVKPEYLLDEPDFRRVMEARTAAAAGNPEQEQALEQWAPVEQSFESYSTQAWNCVLLQVFKIFALARVTPAALRQLLSSTHTTGSNASAGAAQPIAVGGRQSVHAGSTSAAAVEGAAAASSCTASVTVPGGFEVAPDETLARSNIYSTAEACLLAWMTAHMAKSFPQMGYQVTNFSQDLRNGLVIGSLLAAYWPGGKAGTLLSRLHQSMNDDRKTQENQDMVVKAMQELGLPYELTVSELDEADPSSMLMLTAYLFIALPQLLPRATLDFKCKLGESQVWDVQLANPTKRPLSYAARLEGHSDFSLEAGLVKIEPGRTTQVPVRFSPTTSLGKTCRLVLMSRRDSGAASAATLVFMLKGHVDSRSPLKMVAVQAPLYQLGVSEINITNPFPADCDFSISIVPQPLESAAASSADKKGKAAYSSSGSPSKAGGTAASPNKKQAEQLQQQQQRQLAVSQSFPDAFGLERHRVRLRPGASEKLKLSFLPFLMPSLQQQPSATTADGQPAPPKALTKSLLVLSDSECGEFAYELCGEVLPPAPFLEHKAIVGLEGNQTVEFQLSFINHLLEGARRTYAEKHPLAKDKEQAAKLRSDIGKSSDKGERVLQYSVSCSNPLISCPQTVLLKAGSLGGTMVSTSGAMRAGSAHGAAAAPGSAVNSVSGARQSSGGTGQQPGLVGTDNMLKLGLKPIGCGVYPARLTLTSDFDVRVVDVEITAQSSGQQCMLELESPARQQVLQEVPVVNSTENALSASATICGKGYSGPREVTISPNARGVYPLTFCPPGSGTYTGTLELFIAATGERNVYNLVGKGGEPLAEGHIVVEGQARTVITKRLQVPNITGTVPLIYSVYSDLECLSGPDTFTCSSISRGDTYKLSVLPLVAGTTWGSISFVTEDGQYCWYSLEVRASEPPDLGTISVSCPVRQAVAIQVQLTNPTDKPLMLRADYSCPSLVGPNSFIAPPREPAVFECYYAPLLLKQEEGVVRLISQEAGEFLWRINMDALPGGPEQLPLLTAELGRTATHIITVANPTAADATFTCSSSDTARFAISPGSLTVPAQGTAEVQLEYKPGSLGVEEAGSVTVASETAGSVEYICKGKGELPRGAESANINAALGTLSNNSKLAWLNPFSSPAAIRVQLLTSEPAGIFSLMLKGTETVEQAVNSAASSSRSRRGTQHGSSGASTSRSLGVAEQENNVMCNAARQDYCPESLDADIDEQLQRLQMNNAAQNAVDNLLQPPLAGLGVSLAATNNSNDNGVRHKAAPGTRLQLPQQPANQPSPVLQQHAEVTVPPNSMLQLPVSFCPKLLKKAEAQLRVSLMSPAVSAAEPLVWNYLVQGLAHADAHGVNFSVKCKAKQSVEQVLAIPLPGLDVNLITSAHSSARSLDAAGGNKRSTTAENGVTFSHELVIPDEHKAALAAALSIEQVDHLPVVTAGQPPVLQLKLLFAPQKAIAAKVQLAINCSTGARWMYDLNLGASAPEVEGVLVLEAHMGCTAELPLMVYSSGSQPQPFTADFTPDSPLNFDVLPSKGLLPPAPGEGQSTEGTSAPMKITFLCKELGKVMTGKLKVVTPDSEHTYIVKGRQPAYMPPSRSALPSGTYLSSPTASSRARSPSITSGLQKSTPEAGANGATQQKQGGNESKASESKKNFLQQNIRSAKSGTNASKSGDGSNSSRPHTWQGR